MNIDDVLKCDDGHHEIVKVPEWGGELMVKSITGIERCELEKHWPRNGAGDPRGVRVTLLSSAVKTLDGEPFGTREQIAKLVDTKNAVVVERLVAACLRVCGFSDTDVKELEKN